MTSICSLLLENVLYSIAFALVMYSFYYYVWRIWRSLKLSECDGTHPITAEARSSKVVLNMNDFVEVSMTDLGCHQYRSYLLETSSSKSADKAMAETFLRCDTRTGYRVYQVQLHEMFSIFGCVNTLYLPNYFAFSLVLTSKTS